jgi:hypothetical protein
MSTVPTYEIHPGFDCFWVLRTHDDHSELIERFPSLAAAEDFIGCLTYLQSARPSQAPKRNRHWWVILLALALTACAEPSPAPVQVSEHHASATDELARQQGELLAHYDAALTRAEALLRKATIVIAAAKPPTAPAEAKAEESLASKARKAAIEQLEQEKNAAR